MDNLVSGLSGKARITRPQTRQSRQERINVDDDHLTYITNHLNKVGLYIAAEPVSPDHCYFEMEIVDAGRRTAMGIGLVPYEYPMDSMPGWRQFSIGYHADDGNLFKAVGKGSPFGPTSGVGDRMGCGVKFKPNVFGGLQNQQVNVFFTRNGREVGTVTVRYPPGGLYPAVGLHSDGEQVRLNLDAEWQEETVAFGGENRTIPKHFRHERIVIDGEYLSYIANPRNTVGLYIATDTLSHDKNYFEIEIVDSGLKSAIGIGLVPYDYPMDCQPGWKQFSIGYHADDGNLFKNAGLGESFGPTCKTGDRMGCGIKFQRNQEERRCPEQTHQVFFTKNGVEIGTVTVQNPQGGLYPAVGLHSNGEKIRLNMDAEWQSVIQNLGQDRVDSSTKTNTLETVNEWLYMLKMGINRDEFNISFDIQSRPELQKTGALLVDITKQLQDKTSKSLSTKEALHVELQLLQRDIKTLSDEKCTLIIEETNDDPALVKCIKQLRKELYLKKEIFTSKASGFQNKAPETHSIHDLGSDEVGSNVTDVCAFCATNGKLNPAQYYCKDCSQFGRYICGVCRGNHDMFTNNHNVARIAT